MIAPIIWNNILDCFHQLTIELLAILLANNSHTFPLLLLGFLYESDQLLGRIRDSDSLWCFHGILYYSAKEQLPIQKHKLLLLKIATARFQAKDGAAALPFGAFFVTLSPQRPDRPEGGEATKQTTIKTRTHT